jgi:hypothetical protein
MRDVVILRDLKDDVGGPHTVWCGPCVLAGFTGASLAAAEAALDLVGCSDHAAVSNDHLSAAFALFGFAVRGLVGFEGGLRPPLWRFLKTLDHRRHAETRLIVGVELFDVSHWVATCGLAMPLICDSLGLGRWVRLDEEGPHAAAPVWAAWRVERGSWL